MATSPALPPQLDFSPPPLVSICHRKTPLLATAGNGHVTGHLARETATTTAVAKRENNSIASDSAPPHRSPPPPPLPPLLPPTTTSSTSPTHLSSLPPPSCPHLARHRFTVSAARTSTVRPCALHWHRSGTRTRTALAPHAPHSRTPTRPLHAHRLTYIAHPPRLHHLKTTPTNLV